jgi:hypothetical protein
MATAPETPPGSESAARQETDGCRNSGSVRHEGGRRDRCKRSSPIEAGCGRDVGRSYGVALQGRLQTTASRLGQKPRW